MGVKVKLLIEPDGDKKAVVRVTHKPAEEGKEPEVAEYSVAAMPVVGGAEYLLQLGGEVSVQVTKVVELEYDKDQAALVEKPGGGQPVKAVEAKEAGVAHREERGESSGRGRR
jgi:hypothetical protein